MFETQAQSLLLPFYEVLVRGLDNDCSHKVPFSKSQKYTFLSLELCSGGRRAKRADRQPKNGKNKICQKISPKKSKSVKKSLKKIITFQSFSGKSSNDFLSTKTENDGLFNVILTYFKTMKNCLGISVIKRKNKICFTIRCDQL